MADQCFLIVLMRVLLVVSWVNSLFQLFWKVLWRVVSVGVELLILGSQMDTFTAIFLDLLFTTIFSSCLFFPFTSIFLGSACVFLVVVVLVLSVVVFSFCFCTLNSSDFSSAKTTST